VVGALRVFGLKWPAVSLSTAASLRYVPMILVGALAAVVGFALQPNVLVDDAAISFRYAERISAGQGFTYNDHERVQGASNPLYTLLLAILHRVGMDLELAARGLALVLFIVCILLAMHVAERLSTRFGGLLAGVLLAIDPFFRYQSLSGMESALAAVLGLAVVASLLHGRTRTAGVFLGLAVLNKLDAGLLAVAVAGAWVVVRQRFPITLTAMSLAVALPWFAFATVYFGSPVPNSVLVKIQEHEYAPFDRLRVVHFLTSEGRLWYMLGAAALLWYYRHLDTSARLATLALAGWFLLHALALSIVNFGAPYPWYKTVLIPPIIILACAFAGRVLAERPSPVATLARLGVVVVLTLAVAPAAVSTAAGLLAGNPMTDWEAFEADRRAAGEFLAGHAAPDEIVDSSEFGWVASSIPNPVNDSSRLNSRNMLPNPAYSVRSGPLWGDQGGAPPLGPPGNIPLATFESGHRRNHDYNWNITIFGRPDSVIARSGLRTYTLADLPPPEPVSEDSGLQDVEVQNGNLFAHPPSGATFTIKTEQQQPASVSFTPSFSPDVPVDQTDGVTFEVWSGRERIYQSHVLPNDPTSAVTLRLPDARTADELRLSFVTTAGPSGRQDYDWAIWRDVRILIGERK
jgi:hypothetical protein